ncbi:zinc ribbon domain-containing protein [Erythrobacter sp. SD-21]|uniref:zinc ribbon domain-containing protein n=1 Tax=Erythrobacter sp. SD-21 TaxID=161528 RepID=UPI000153EEB3|nr:zinc ribbon domain-containing protein [Erythrobacter sp. SD-21]EDL47983.1 hypothetical protein ED21_25592 [Erythrobacter sp. SD-21]
MLFVCPDCREPISDKADACPNCGRPADDRTFVEPYFGPGIPRNDGFYVESKPVSELISALKKDGSFVIRVLSFKGSHPTINWDDLAPTDIPAEMYEVSYKDLSIVSTYREDGDFALGGELQNETSLPWSIADHTICCATENGFKLSLKVDQWGSLRDLESETVYRFLFTPLGTC